MASEQSVVTSSSLLRELGTSYFGSCEACAGAPEVLCEKHKQEVADLGMRLASVIDRSLWRNDLLPQKTAKITQEHGIKIQIEAFKKVKKICHYVVKQKEKSRKLGMSPKFILSEDLKSCSSAKISASPELFKKILLIAQKIDFEQMIDIFSYFLPWRDAIPMYQEVKEFRHLAGRSCPVKTFPDSIEDLTSLVDLVLSDNVLKYLPETFGNLPALKYLDLSRNRLKTLPDSLGKLNTLEHLLLDTNQLISLPESIGDLSSLTRLWLMNNKLGSLPLSLEKLPRLTKLDIRGNQIWPGKKVCCMLLRLRQRGCEVTCDSVIERGIRNVTK